MRLGLIEIALIATVTSKNEYVITVETAFEIVKIIIYYIL